MRWNQELFNKTGVFIEISAAIFWLIYSVFELFVNHNLGDGMANLFVAGIFGLLAKMFYKNMK